MSRLNAALGSLVITFGFWMIWGQAPVLLLAAIAVAVAGLLAWRCGSIGQIWAWTTLVLGIESFAFPVAGMIQLRMTTEQPTEEQMVGVLTAILFGVFSSVFWLSFSYGIFKRIKARNRGEGK